MIFAMQSSNAVLIDAKSSAIDLESAKSPANSHAAKS